MTGEMAAAESDDFGDWLAMDYEHSKAQIAAGGCGIAGGDCPDGFEHAPFRCGAEVICGDCGVVMPRGLRSYCARDAPRFWSKLGSRCDHGSPRIVRQRQAAWQVYAELQSRGTAQGQQALPLDQEPVRRRRSEEGGRKGCSGGASAGAGAGEQASSLRSPSGGGIGRRMESCQGTVPMGGSSGRLLQTHTQSGGRLRSRTAERGADGTPDRGAVRMLRFGSDQPPPRQVCRSTDSDGKCSQTLQEDAAGVDRWPKWLQKAIDDLEGTRPSPPPLSAPAAADAPTPLAVAPSPPTLLTASSHRTEAAERLQRYWRGRRRWRLIGAVLARAQRVSAARARLAAREAEVRAVTAARKCEEVRRRTESRVQETEARARRGQQRCGEARDPSPRRALSPPRPMPPPPTPPGSPLPPPPSRAPPPPPSSQATSPSSPPEQRRRETAELAAAVANSWGAQLVVLRRHGVRPAVGAGTGGRQTRQRRERRKAAAQQAEIG